MLREFAYLDASFATPEQARQFLHVTTPIGRFLHPGIREARSRAMDMINAEKVQDLAHRARQAVAHCFSHNIRHYGVSDDVVKRLTVIGDYDAVLCADDIQAVRLAEELLHKVKTSFEDILENPKITEVQYDVFERLSKKKIAQ